MNSMISFGAFGVIIGMIYQTVLLYVLSNTDDEVLEKIIIFIEACSVMVFMLLALKGYVS